MTEQEQANTRVLRWRSESVLARSGQAAMVAVLCWLLTSESLVFAWLACTIAAGVLDSVLCRRLLARRDSRPLFAACCAGMALSAATFSGMSLLFLKQGDMVGLTGACLALCAVALDNAVMTRGSKAFSMALVGPAALVLVAAPTVANAMGLAIGAGEVALLSLGGAIFAAFIASMAATLHRENETLLFALETQERQKDYARGARRKAEEEGNRWSLVFNQSPLAQICFDASRLRARLDIDGDGRALGDRLSSRFETPGAMLEQISMTDANEAALDLFGIERGEQGIESRHFGMDFHIGFARSVNEVSEDGVFPPFDSRILRSDGTPVDVRVHIRTAPDEERPWSLCIATFVDMTEVRIAARALREAVEASESANQAKSDFLAMMSHEIRTPLNGILGMAQAMVSDRLSAAQRKRIDIIRTSGQALLAILNDVLDLSKIEAGKLELEAAPFDLADLAESARMAFEALAKEKGVAFALEVAEEARGIYEGDVVRVRQIVLNLLSNAVKFTEAGSVSLTVGRTGDGVRLAVSDTGAGIAPDRVGRLFEKFVQADSSTTRRFGGTGLGLSITRELCAAMGGSIEVQSALGQGSTFTVDLPLPRIGEAPTDGPARVAQPPASLERSLRVLAAEDNAINQLVLRTLLEQAGIEPTIVGDGAAALEAWRSEDWDLILMDVQMPVMDGPAATRRIRQLEAKAGRPRIPIIALTANAMSHQMEQYRASGMDGFVAKPIEIARLYEAIDEALRGRPSAKAATA